MSSRKREIFHISAQMHRDVLQIDKFASVGEEEAEGDLLFATGHSLPQYKEDESRKVLR